MHPCVGPSLNDGWNTISHHEPAGSTPITTGSISKCASFWKIFVKSKWVMRWINHGYDLAGTSISHWLANLRTLSPLGTNLTLSQRQLPICFMRVSGCRFGSPTRR